MALLGTLLAMAAAVMAAPAPIAQTASSTYQNVTFVIFSQVALNSYPMTGGSFSVTRVSSPSWSDPLNRNKVGKTVPLVPVGPFFGNNGVKGVLSLQPQPAPRTAISQTNDANITGTLVLQNSQPDSSLSTTTFPNIMISINQVLDPGTVNITGPNCLPNGSPGEFICPGTDAYGVSILGTFTQWPQSSIIELLSVMWNAH